MTNPGRRIRENENQYMSNGKKLLKWIITYRFVFIVIVYMIQNLLYVTYTSLGLAGENLIGSGTFMLLLIFCILAVSRDKKSLWIGIIWGGCSIIAAWLAILFNLINWLLVTIFISFYNSGYRCHCCICISWSALGFLFYVGHNRTYRSCSQ